MKTVSARYDGLRETAGQEWLEALACDRLAVADRREGAAGLWLGASIALTRVRCLR